MLDLIGPRLCLDGPARWSDCQLLDYCIAMAADLAPRDQNEEIMYSKISSTGEGTNYEPDLNDQAWTKRIDISP